MDEAERAKEIAELKARLAALEGPAPSAPVPPKPAPGESRALPKPVLAAVLVVVGLGLITAWLARPTPRPIGPSPVVPAAPPAATVPPPPAAPAAGATAWNYTEHVDPLTDKKTNIACVDSVGPVRLEPPYGNVTAQLCIRKAPDGLATFVRLLGDGQFICTSYDGCTVQVRFDKAPASAFSAAEPSDNSSNFIFITNASRMTAGLKTAERTLVSATFYEAGTQTMEFDTKGLKWPPGATAGGK